MRTQPASRRGRRLLGAALVAGAAGLTLVVVPASLGGAHARFSATTANAGDVFATDQLQPPAGLTATQSCTVTPALTHRTATGATGTTSISLTPPTGTTAGDLLVVHVAQRGGTETITAPAGWTLVTQDTSSSQVTSEIYWKVATASEPTAVFSRSASDTGGMAGGIFAYIGADLAAPVPGYGPTTGTGVTASTSSSVTTTATNAEVLHLLTKVQDTLPAPTGTTSLGSVSSGGGPSSVGLTAADETFPGPGTVPSRSSTSTGGTNSEWIAQTLVLRRAAGTPTAHLTWPASTSAWGTGYVLDRQVAGSTQATQTITGVASTSATDGPLTNGTSYTFRLTTFRASWRSASVTATLTPSC